MFCIIFLAPFVLEIVIRITESTFKVSYQSSIIINYNVDRRIFGEDFILHVCRLLWNYLLCCKIHERATHFKTYLKSLSTVLCNTSDLTSYIISCTRFQHDRSFVCPPVIGGFISQRTTNAGYDNVFNSTIEQDLGQVHMSLTHWPVDAALILNSN